MNSGTTPAETHRTSYFAALLAAYSARPNSLAYKLVGPEGTETISFSDHWRNIVRSGYGLRRRGLGKGEVVLIFGHHGTSILSAFFGAQLIGAIPSFMPPPTGRQDVNLWRSSHRALCERVNPKLIVVSDEFASDVEVVANTSVVLISELDNERCAPLEIEHDCSLNDIAFLQHSSGTTGLKKGVVVTYRQIGEQVTAYAQSLKLDVSRNHVVTWLPIYHDMGLIAATLTPAILGMSVTWIDTMTWLASPSLIIDELQSVDGALCWMPNFAFSYVAQRYRGTLDKTALASVHAIINCSEPCKISDMTKFITRFSTFGLNPEKIRVCYAMAEYVFAVTQTTALLEGPKALSVDRDAYAKGQVIYSDDEDAVTITSVGSPIPGAEIRISGGVRDGVIGDVEVTGSSLCSGYYLNDEATAQKFVGGWYRTGDFGFIWRDELYITGRADDLIIVRGKNIYAHDVEAVVTNTGLIRPGRCVAIGIEDRTGTQRLIVIAERLESHDEAVVNHIAEAVTGEVGVSPSEVLIVDINTLIKTSSGKVSRAENAKRYRAGTLERWV